MINERIFNIDNWHMIMIHCWWLNKSWPSLDGSRMTWYIARTIVWHCRLVWKIPVHGQRAVRTWSDCVRSISRRIPGRLEHVVGFVGLFVVSNVNHRRSREIDPKRSWWMSRRKSTTGRPSFDAATTAKRHEYRANRASDWIWARSTCRERSLPWCWMIWWKNMTNLTDAVGVRMQNVSHRPTVSTTRIVFWWPENHAFVSFCNGPTDVCRRSSIVESIPNWMWMAHRCRRRSADEGFRLNKSRIESNY